MRVAVIGGTGFVGGYLIDALVLAGHEPSVLVRPGSEHKLRRHDDCRLVAGDVSSVDATNSALKGCDACIFNIGILREIPRKGVTFEALQYEAAVRVLDAAKANGVSRFLLMSANGVRTGGTAYQDTKARAEEAALASGLNVTIFQPSVIFGDPRGTMEFATQLCRDMVLPPLPAAAFYTGWSPTKGSVCMSPVHVEDVADAFVSALDSSSTFGQRIRLGGRSIMTWTDMLRVIANAVHRRKWIVPVPISVMKLAATLFDWLPFFPVTRDQLTMLAEGNSASSAELERLIGHEPRDFAVTNLSYLAPDTI
jgi:NADH dehydrogenase